MEHLKEVLDEIFGVRGSAQKDAIIAAVKKDNKPKEEMAEVLLMVNEVFGKRYRVMSKKAISGYKQVLKVYSMDELKKAMLNAKMGENHIKNNFNWLTPEFFSRMDKVDLWFNANTNVKEDIFQMPHMNLKK